MKDIDHSRKRDWVCAINSLATLLLVLSIDLPGLCRGQTSGSWNGLNYSVSGTNITITGFITEFSPPDGALNIPSSIPGVQGSVTSIGVEAFFFCFGLTSITIPDSVTSIGDSAFCGCYGLTSFTIPDSVTNIGTNAFGDCYSLTSVTIPDSVTSIGNSAFALCSGLTSVSIGKSVSSIGCSAFSSCPVLEVIAVAPGSTFYSSLNGVLFNKSESILVEYPGGLAGPYTIPSSVTDIGDFAFSDCSALTGVSIPNSVNSIGDNAFSGCSGLTSVTIPSSVNSIGNSAFSGFSGLKEISVASGNAFYSSLNGVLFDKNQSLLIQYPGGLSGTYSIPGSVSSIGDGAFESCWNLTSVTIPSSVISIGDGAFSGCSGLTSVTIPGRVTSIGDSAFFACSDLTSVTIPNSVTSIGEDAFGYCTMLAKAYFQGNAPSSFGSAVFYSTTSDFTIYYPSCAAGWTTPAWMGYPACPYNYLVAATAAYNRSPNTPLIVTISDLLTNVGCCGSVSLVGVGTDGYNLLSTNGVTLITNANFIFYTNSVTPNTDDSFEYTVQDSQGDTTMGTVFVTVSSGNVPGPPINVVVSARSVTLNVLGVPNYSYSVERSTDLAHWVSISANILAPGTGLMQVVDTFDDLGKEPQFAFYRVQFAP